MSIVASDDFDAEPSAAELAAIEDEAPVIAAELDLLDAELAILNAPRPTELDWHRVRAAERSLVAAHLMVWLFRQAQRRSGREAA
jgi:hypothetical protein